MQFIVIQNFIICGGIMKNLKSVARLQKLLNEEKEGYFKYPHFVEIVFGFEEERRIHRTLDLAFGEMSGYKYNLQVYSIYAGSEDIVSSLCIGTESVRDSVFEYFVEENSSKNLQAVRVDIYKYNEKFLDEHDFQEKFYIGTWVIYY